MTRYQPAMPDKTRAKRCSPAHLYLWIVLVHHELTHDKAQRVDVTLVSELMQLVVQRVQVVICATHISGHKPTASLQTRGVNDL